MKKLLRRPFLRIFNSEFEDFPIQKTHTPCCAVCFLSIKNFHTKQEIQQQIKDQKREAYSRSWVNTDTRFGQKTMVVIVSPGEGNLEKNLKELDFKLLTDNLPRRQGYPGGLLKMYALSV